jgi:hypothetical protein
MNIAIDLDGTITKAPDVFRAIISSFLLTGHNVTVLTAAAGELSPEARPAEVRKRLGALQIPFTNLICCESHEKPAIVQSANMHLVIDDGNFSFSNALFLQVK